MAEMFQVIEQDIREISRVATQTLSMLALADGTTNPARSRSFIDGTSQLREMWARHLMLENHVFPLILSYDRHFVACFDRLEREHAEVQSGLDALDTSNQVRAVETLTLVLRQLEQERRTVLPLLRRWLPEEFGPDTLPPDSFTPQIASV
jgi:hypothetical protein